MTTTIIMGKEGFANTTDFMASQEIRAHPSTPIVQPVRRQKAVYSTAPTTGKNNP